MQTEDEAGIVRGSLNRIVTTKAPIAQIDELFEEPISIYSEYEDNEVSDKDHIDDQAPEEPGNGKSREEGKSTNRKNRRAACGNGVCKVLF